MLPAVLLGGVLLVRKLRQGEMVLLFVTASLVTVCIVSLRAGAFCDERATTIVGRVTALFLCNYYADRTADRTTHAKN